uniref:(California timema) hypothetical protein n=1 Tax=Timema californicum TaxID=61474 RepID=A0A7R9J6R2_TIMCA|nr:unnamed protein product [Timema californicum]
MRRRKRDKLLRKRKHGILQVGILSPASPSHENQIRRETDTLVHVPTIQGHKDIKARCTHPFFQRTVLRDWSCVCDTVAALWVTAGQYVRKMDVRYRNVTGGRSVFPTLPLVEHPVQCVTPWGKEEDYVPNPTPNSAQHQPGVTTSKAPLQEPSLTHLPTAGMIMMATCLEECLFSLKINLLTGTCPGGELEGAVAGVKGPIVDVLDEKRHLHFSCGGVVLHRTCELVVGAEQIISEPGSGIGKVIFRGSVPAFVWKVENHFGKTTLNKPNRDSNLDLPIIDSLICKISTLAHATTKYSNIDENYKTMVLTLCLHHFIHFINNVLQFMPLRSREADACKCDLECREKRDRLCSACRRCFGGELPDGLQVLREHIGRVDGALSEWIDIEQDVRQSYAMSPCMRDTYEDPVHVQIDNVNVLSRLWNGPKSVPGRGCGAMFEIMVEAADFQGMNTVKQHRLINENADEIVSFAPSRLQPAMRPGQKQAKQSCEKQGHHYDTQSCRGVLMDEVSGYLIDQLSGQWPEFQATDSEVHGLISGAYKMYLLSSGSKMGSNSASC